MKILLAFCVISFFAIGSSHANRIPCEPEQVRLIDSIAVRAHSDHFAGAIERVEKEFPEERYTVSEGGVIEAGRTIERSIKLFDFEAELLVEVRTHSGADTGELRVLRGCFKQAPDEWSQMSERFLSAIAPDFVRVS